MSIVLSPRVWTWERRHTWKTRVPAVHLEKRSTSIPSLFSIITRVRCISLSTHRSYRLMCLVQLLPVKEVLIRSWKWHESKAFFFLNESCVSYVKFLMPTFSKKLFLAMQGMTCQKWKQINNSYSAILTRYTGLSVRLHSLERMFEITTHTGNFKMQQLWCYKNWQLEIDRCDYVIGMKNMFDVSLGIDAATGKLWVVSCRLKFVWNEYIY